MLTPQQPVINAVLITYIDYSNYGKLQGAAKRTHRVSAMSLDPHAHQIYLPAISFFRVTSNQMSTFENLVQSTI